MKLFMENWRWRLQQFQSIFTPIFYITTLTLLVYPYISHRLDIDGVKGGLILIWVCMAGLVMAGAYVWTDVLEMWRTAQYVNTVIRNQYQGEGKLTPFQRYLIERVHMPVMEATKADTTKAKACLKEDV